MSRRSRFRLHTLVIRFVLFVFLSVYAARILRKRYRHRRRMRKHADASKLGSGETSDEDEEERDRRAVEHQSDRHLARTRVQRHATPHRLRLGRLQNIVRLMTAAVD